jgi:hypothetical protein
MAKAVKTKTTKPVKTKPVKTETTKVTPGSVAKSIAQLSHEDRAKLYAGFSKNVEFDNNAVSLGKTPDGDNYQEWANSFE